METKNREHEVAKAILRIGAVGFAPDKPITFKSGMIAPTYVDNRKFPFNPSEWKVIIESFKEIIETNKIELDVIAGVEAAGIPHSAALGFHMNIPSIFVRKKIKDHGTKSRIEGGKVDGKKVLLIEDLVTTGGSSLESIRALKEEGAIAKECLIIVSYGFKEAIDAFEKEGVRLTSLTSFPIILEEAVNMGKITIEESQKIQEWLDDPHGWAGKHGFA
jgi:orotate phosphoribosyltransferase